MDMYNKNPKVLVIEDDPSYSRLLQMYVERAGASCDICDDGNQALYRVLSGSYDFVLVDMHLPGMDGIMLAVMLRDKGYTKPLIAITALKLENIEENALKAGLDEFIEKPVTFEKIQDLFQRYAESNVH
jgi:DNA-binding response OmpR family regulator